MAAVLLLVSVNGTALASDWEQVGTKGRPRWVADSAERRLRLLPAVPEWHDHARDHAKAYFGDQGPGMSIGLVLDDGLFYSEGFGFGDGERKVRPDEHTIFRGGSLSKVMTATALLTLVDDPARHVALNDAADKERYLPELKFVCPSFDESCDRGAQRSGITLKHLASHTSGMPNVLAAHADVGPWLAQLKKSWLLFEPGSFGAYAGVAVEGLGLIEERISGQKYVDFVDDHLFAPLGMTHSTMDEKKRFKGNRAQKWFFKSDVAVSSSCISACTAAEGKCMDRAHSSAERKQCVAERKTCQGDCPPPKAGWRFERVEEELPGDAQLMFYPAGSVATSVRDMSLFIKMWLNLEAPEVRGRPLIKRATLDEATKPAFPRAGTLPARCKQSGVNDKNGNSYSQCGNADGFGMGWYVGNGPYIEHTGGIGVSGSNTRVDRSRKMGATGLISTEPFPSLPRQPPDLDPSFISTVVNGMLSGAQAADLVRDWSGRPLPIGVARLLLLSGKKPEPTDLDAFTGRFVAAHSLQRGSIVSFLRAWQTRVGACSNFRVNDVHSETDVDLVVTCDKEAWRVRLSVEKDAPHRISWADVAPSAWRNSPPSPNGADHQSPAPSAACLAGCSRAQTHCMSTAHSSGDRQSCVHMARACRQDCD